MVKRPVEGKDKATTRRSRKELICDLRQPWLQEQYRPLTLAPNIGHLTAEARLNGDFIMHQAGKRKGKEICKIVSSTAMSRNNIKFDVAGRYRRPTVNKWDLVTCPSCQAVVWTSEAVVQETRNTTRKFSICCQQGRVQLPPKRQPPSPLKELLDRPSFMLQIRVANGMLAFTSMGGQIDHTVTSTPGPFAFRLHGQTHHRIGSLLPPEGKLPQFSQLYIVDTDNELENRKKAFNKGKSALTVDDNLIAELIKMLDENNHLAKTLRHARDRILSGDTVEFSITLVNQKHRGRQYDLPTAGEIGGLLVGDFSADSAGKDIVLEYKSSKLQRISDLHPLYMSLQYPLLFPYGEYDERIPYQVTENSKIQREHMTMREYFAHQIQTRPTEGMTIIKAGRLLHQYIVDAYVATEQERLRFIRHSQKKLRAELFTNVCDALERGDTDASQLGKKVILPSSFTGGPRYMSEKYQDAMAICRWYGNPHLFITLTANPNWVQLKEHLDVYGGDSPNNRPDLECRVFKLKLEEMMSDFKKGVFFPKPAAVVYTIEFQKCGLPHAHILLWFEGFKGEATPAVALYLPRPVFSHGQLYVALSRVTTPEGLKVLDDTEGGTRKDAVTNIVYREIFSNLRASNNYGEHPRSQH
uniref:Helitron helicase-like domain-containing protein n=1 Tax=Brassica oleracea var. oleracea TaxID=109376 RepID=A0A0D3BBU1_BRAOL